MAANKGYISIGKGNRLMSEDYFLDHLKPLGVTRLGFRKWCRAMGVPMLHFPDEKRYLDVYTFKIALRAICRIGQPDFLLPGAKDVRHRRKKDLKWDKQCTVQLDPTYIRDNWQEIVSELLAARLEPNDPLRENLREVAKLAANRLVSYTNVILHEQERDALIAKKAASQKGVFQELE